MTIGSDAYSPRAVFTAPGLDRLWLTRCAVPTASGVAVDTGLLGAEFASDGVTVESLRVAVDAAVHDAHVDHTLPSSFREGGHVPALWARAKGRRTRLIGLGWVDEFQSLLAAPGSAITRPEDLRGRRVVVPRRGTALVDVDRASALRGLDATLATVGLTREDVELVDVAHSGPAYAAELAALRRGEADAFFASGVRGDATRTEHGLRTVLDLSASADAAVRANSGVLRTITVREELLHERFDLVTRYLSALLRASSWAEANPAAAHAVLAAESGATVASTLSAHGAEVHRALRPDFTVDLVEALTAQKDFLLREGFLDADVDLASWLALEPLVVAQRREDLAA